MGAPARNSCPLHTYGWTWARTRRLAVASCRANRRGLFRRTTCPAESAFTPERASIRMAMLPSVTEQHWCPKAQEKCEQCRRPLREYPGGLTYVESVASGTRADSVTVEGSIRDDSAPIHEVGRYGGDSARR